MGGEQQVVSKRGAGFCFDDENLDRDIPKWHEYQQHAARNASRSSSPLTLTAAMSPVSSPSGEHRRVTTHTHQPPLDLDRVTCWSSKLSSHTTQSRLSTLVARALPHHVCTVAVGEAPVTWSLEAPPEAAAPGDDAARPTLDELR